MTSIQIVAAAHDEPKGTLSKHVIGEVLKDKFVGVYPNPGAGRISNHIKSLFIRWVH